MRVAYAYVHTRKSRSRASRKSFAWLNSPGRCYRAFVYTLRTRLGPYCYYSFFSLYIHVSPPLSTCTPIFPIRVAYRSPSALLRFDAEGNSGVARVKELSFLQDMCFFPSLSTRFSELGLKITRVRVEARYCAPSRANKLRSVVEIDARFAFLELRFC